MENAPVGCKGMERVPFMDSKLSNLLTYLLT